MTDDQELRQRICEAIDDCTRGLDNAPSLSYQIARRARGEEPMKKKLSTAMTLVLAALLLTMTGALAAAMGRWGLIDFAGNHADAYVPASYEDSIKPETATGENGLAACTIQQSYYDGKILRVVAQVTAKGGETLFGPGTSPDFPVTDLFPELEDDGTTVADYALAHSGGRLVEVELMDSGIRDDASLTSMDFRLNEDGTATLYLESQLKEEQPELDTTLTLYAIPLTVTAEGQTEYDLDRRETADILMHFTAVPVKTFACREPLDFPSVGVQVTGVTLTVTPLEIRTQVAYTVTDVAAYEAQDGGLWFEFINPDSTADTPYEQRVSGGLTSGSAVQQLDADFDQPVAVGSRFIQTDAIGLDALSDSYTLRAYSAWEKTRFEAVTFQVAGE